MIATIKTIFLNTIYKKKSVVICNCKSMTARMMERLIYSTPFCTLSRSCSVAANHEALSRLRLGFKSRQEHHTTIIFLFCPDTDEKLLKKSLIQKQCRCFMIHIGYKWSRQLTRVQKVIYEMFICWGLPNSIIGPVFY